MAETLSEFGPSTSGRQCSEIVPRVARQTLEVLGKEKFLRFQQIQNEFRRQRQAFVARLQVSEGKIAAVSRAFVSSIQSSSTSQVS